MILVVGHNCISKINDEGFTCYGQTTNSAYTARSDYCTNPPKSNHIQNSNETTAWIKIDLQENHFLSQIKFRPRFRPVTVGDPKKIKFTYSDGNFEEFGVGKVSSVVGTDSITINPIKKTQTISITGLTKDMFEEGSTRFGYSSIEIYRCIGIYRETL